MKTTPRQKRLARSRRTHAVTRASGRPRLVVYRSNTATYAQLVDDASGKVLAGTKTAKGKNTIAGATSAGEEIAKLAKKAKVDKIAFDRNGYQYHGKVKAIAEGARKGGLEF